jgi:hypothetical protein
LRDSLFNEEFLKNLSNVQTKFAERENLATINTKQQIIEQQILIIVLVSVVTVSIMAVAILLYRNNRLRQQCPAGKQSAGAHPPIAGEPPGFAATGPGTNGNTDESLFRVKKFYGHLKGACAPKPVTL